MARPPFICSTADVPEHAHTYPHSSEPMGPVRRLGKQAGLQRIGVNVQRLPPRTRSSWPHAEENEEEFVYVLQGEVDAWVDGVLHRMVPGDLAAFPAGTGISHCFINNGDADVLLLVGGEAPRPGSRIFYPLHPSRRSDMGLSDWWDDVPARELGPHDGQPDAARDAGRAAATGASRSATGASLLRRQLISSGSEFEARIGYSRAVAVGDWVFVSGTTGFDYATMTIGDSLLEQTEQCMKNIAAALREAGASLADVVRATYVLPDAAAFPTCWPVLRKHFGDVRPAAMMISAGLADPRMRIEIEVTALRGSSGPGDGDDAASHA